MSKRMEFISRLNAGERMTDLCREYGISRKTGYKFKKRFEERGPRGLFDVSRRPDRSPNRISVEVEALFVQERTAHPTWGPRKLRKVLADRHPGVKMPALSTIWKLLKRNGLVEPRKRKRRAVPYTAPLAHARRPNDVWCIDFKGQFKMGDGRYCYPLTITDACTRYLLCCEALESTQAEPAKEVVRDVFERFGLPQFIRSDNGSPFASTGAFGLTTLSAWWTALGVKHERIEPGHPEQNGRHERMHLTLKREATRPPGCGLLAQQEKFDRFEQEYNHVRPHESLDDETPASLYRLSERNLNLSMLDYDYPLHDLRLKVSSAGHVHPQRHSGLPRQVYVGVALRGLYVGVRELEDGWTLALGRTELGFIPLGANTIQPL